jgi:hypothetical protein
VTWTRPTASTGGRGWAAAPSVLPPLPLPASLPALAPPVLLCGSASSKVYVPLWPGPRPACRQGRLWRRQLAKAMYGAGSGGGGGGGVAYTFIRCADGGEGCTRSGWAGPGAVAELKRSRPQSRADGCYCGAESRLAAIAELKRAHCGAEARTAAIVEDGCCCGGRLLYCGGRLLLRR